MLKIGDRIRVYRLKRGLSQGDIEARTGLLRCYISRVENGHTVPSLETLARIAAAMEMPLVGFFLDLLGLPDGETAPELSDEAIAFLTHMRRYAASLNERDRAQVLSMVKALADPAAEEAETSREAAQRPRVSHAAAGAPQPD